MNKEELLDAIAVEASLTKADSRKALDAAIKAVVGILKCGGFLEVVGFGNLEVHQHKKRSWRTRSGKTVVIPSHKTVFFRPCESLKEEVNR
ncbi:MAG: HU family DNA-binding protein [Candidatus Omnitrophota bacterium]